MRFFLSWLGKQGTRAVAAIVLVGILLPSLGALLKPFVTWAVFVLLSISFLRTDVAALKSYIGRPIVVLCATVWSSLAIPLLFGFACLVLGLQTRSQELFLGLMLQGITSPMMAAPALAALMGLDATLVLVTLVTTTLLIPLTAPLFVHFFIGSALTLSSSALGVKLFAILGGSVVVGFALRRIVGIDIIRSINTEIDGFNILILFIFVAAVMEGVGERFLRTPFFMAGLLLTAFGVFLALFCFTAVVFKFAGWHRSLSLGFMVSQRNLGLMLAATGGVLPDLTWVYFALSQFPIYLSPYLFKPLVRLDNER